MRTFNKQGKISNNGGITIIEFLIYFALTIVMLGIIVEISINILQGKEKLKAYQEVGRSGRGALDVISDAVSSAEEVIGTSE